MEQFEGEGRILASVTQWPYVLDALFTLHPELRNQPPQTFALRLGPTSCGAQMVIDSGSHLLSLLQNLVGLGQLERLEGTVETEQAELRFEYCHPGGKIAVCYQLIQTPEAPRPAEIAINGRKMTRQLELDPYQVVFCSEDERLPVRDPLALLVEDFVRSAGGDDARSRLRRKDHLVEGMARLVELSALAHGLIEEDAE